MALRNSFKVSNKQYLQRKLRSQEGGRSARRARHTRSLPRQSPQCHIPIEVSLPLSLPTRGPGSRGVQTSLGHFSQLASGQPWVEVLNPRKAADVGSFGEGENRQKPE